jgi:TIR domain
MHLDFDLMKVVDSNIKKLRTGDFIINHDRAERLAQNDPDKRNILSTLNERIRQYNRSKLGPPSMGLPDPWSLQFCSELFDEAFLNGVLIHNNHTKPKETSKEKNEPIAGKDQNIVSPTDDFDAFISYSEGTGAHHAEIIKRNLERYRIRTFVAHIERPKYSGNFHEKVDNVISICRYFILLINIDTYEREEVIREVKKAYPNGKTQRPKLIVFRQGNTEKTSEEFVTRTGIDISTENQHDFNYDEELATNVISLCNANDIVKVEVELTPELIQKLPSDSTQTQKDQDISHNRANIEEFKRKIAKYKLWKYFQIKCFLYRLQNTTTWKIQLMHIELLETKPDTLTGINTEHLKLLHTVQEIDKLDNLLEEIALGEKITIENTSGSLQLVKDKIKEGSYYRNHPQTEIFAINDASIGLLKPGTTSTELFDNDRILLQEIKDRFDNLPDAVSNILQLPFWDGSYSPFILVFATFPISIVDSEITNTSILLRLNCSSILNVEGIELKLQRKNNRSRQMGETQTITGFQRLTETEALLNTNLNEIDVAEFIVLKLYYYDILIQEKAYSRNQTGTQWFPIN